METSNDRPLVNVYLPAPDWEREQFATAIVESNDEECRVLFTSPDWQSLSGIVSTPSGDFLLTVNHDGAKLEPATTTVVMG